MNELSHEQFRTLVNHMQRAKSFLATVETANRQTAAVRDSIIEDCEQWTDILMRKLDQPSLGKAAE
jgi:hypothetical protein